MAGRVASALPLDLKQEDSSLELLPSSLSPKECLAQVRMEPTWTRKERREDQVLVMLPELQQQQL